MGQGIIKISLEELARVILLPENYKPIGIHYDPVSRECSLVIESEALPEVGKYAVLPTLQVSYTQRHFPEFKEIRVP